MEPTRKLRWERPTELAAEPPRHDPLASLVRLVRAPAGERDAPPPVSHEEWTGLIDRVRAAAGRAREAETQALGREQQLQDLMRRVRAETEAAEERVRAAELRAAAAETRAEARIREAEMRAEQAEARAQTAEDWMMRLHETIANEFAGLGREAGR